MKKILKGQDHRAESALFTTKQQQRKRISQIHRQKFVWLVPFKWHGWLNLSCLRQKRDETQCRLMHTRPVSLISLWNVPVARNPSTDKTGREFKVLRWRETRWQIDLNYKPALIRFKSLSLSNQPACESFSNTSRLYTHTHICHTHRPVHPPVILRHFILIQCLVLFVLNRIWVDMPPLHFLLNISLLSLTWDDRI